MARSVAQTSKVVVIIDDNESMQDSLGDLIESGGFEARCFGSGKAFLDSDLRRRAACLIVDVCMPKMSGLELQATLKLEKCNIPIIFITAFDDDAEVRDQAMKEGAVQFLKKPFNHKLLLEILRCTVKSECGLRSQSMVKSVQKHNLLRAASHGI
jgi:FixJ family two-component response regulator